MTTSSHPIEPAAPYLTKRGRASVFKLPCSNGRSFYVCVCETDSLRPNAHLLWVDATKLRSVWRGRRQAGYTSALARSAADDWLNDYKYAERDPIFNKCFDDPSNPLELTRWCFTKIKKRKLSSPRRPDRLHQRLLQHIQNLFSEKKPQEFEMIEEHQIAPDDGISRSLWMLANRISILPILVTSEDEAFQLFKEVGLPDYPPINIKTFWDEKK